MINTNELLCVVNEYDTPLKPVKRHVAFKKGYWRRTAHVWIINSKNEVLCQQRSMLKDMSPGKWEAGIAGHLGPGDDYFSGAAREVREETGLPVKKSDLNLVKIYKDHETHEFRGLFYCKLDVKLHDIKSEIEEVEKVVLIHINALKKHLQLQNKDAWIIQGHEKDMFSVLA